MHNSIYLFQDIIIYIYISICIIMEIQHYTNMHVFVRRNQYTELTDKLKQIILSQIYLI